MSDLIEKQNRILNRGAMMVVYDVHCLIKKFLGVVKIWKYNIKLRKTAYLSGAVIR